MFLKGIFVALPLAATIGCRGYDVIQSNVFSDDDGVVVRVEYGRSDSDHVNTFRNPGTGRDVDFRSRLLVKVHLPDGDTFKAWQCMNFLASGTMYETDGGEWKFLATGFSCTVFHREADGRYREIYRGILCETVKGADSEPPDKWRKMKKDASGHWR